MEDLTTTLTLSRLESMMTEYFMETQNTMLTHFEEPQESYNFDLEY